MQPAGDNAAMTTAEIIDLLERSDPLATPCLLVRADDGDSYEDPITDVVAMGGTVVLLSAKTMP